MDEQLVLWDYMLLKLQFHKLASFSNFVLLNYMRFHSLAPLKKNIDKGIRRNTWEMGHCRYQTIAYKKGPLWAWESGYGSARYRRSWVASKEIKPEKIGYKEYFV